MVKIGAIIRLSPLTKPIKNSPLYLLVRYKGLFLILYGIITHKNYKRLGVKNGNK